MVKQQWYIKIESKQQGPFSLDELRKHPHVTPDTLVRKDEDEEWVPIGKVKELRALFEDEKQQKERKDEEEGVPPPAMTKDGELTLQMQQSPIPLWLWLLVILFIMMYLFYRLGNY